MFPRRTRHGEIAERHDDGDQNGSPEEKARAAPEQGAGPDTPGPVETKASILGLDQSSIDNLQASSTLGSSEGGNEGQPEETVDRERAPTVVLMVMYEENEVADESIPKRPGSQVADSAYDEENPRPPVSVFVPGEPPETPPLTWKDKLKRVWRTLINFLVDYHMPLLLILALFVGILLPLPGKVLGDVRLNNGLCLIANSTTGRGPVCVWGTLSTLCVSLIFVISGLKLDFNKFKRALTARKEIAVAVLIIFGLTGAFAFAIAAAPKLRPIEFSFGLSLLSLMPTTMSSCVIIVTYAGGNVALALLLTLGTNVIAAAFLPVTVSAMVTVFMKSIGDNQGVAAQVDTAQLCLNLVFQVVVPLLAAVMAKTFYPNEIEPWVERHNHALKVTSATLNALIPWMRISQNSSQFFRPSGVDYLAMLAAGVSLHFLYLGISALCSLKVFKLRSIEEAKAVTFTGAQKTLPIALSVLELLPTSITGDQGLVLVPMVCIYLFQAIVDSYIAVRWKRAEENR